jgi:hypothetical protein
VVNTRRYEIRGFRDGKLWRSTVVLDVDEDEIVHADPPIEWCVGARWEHLTNYVKLRPGWRIGEPTGVPHLISPDAPTPIEDVRATRGMDEEPDA